MKSETGRRWEDPEEPEAENGIGHSTHHTHHRRDHSHLWHERMREFMAHEGPEHWLFGGRRFLSCCAMDGPREVNPLVAIMLSKGGGVLPLLVLHVLSQGQGYGNRIMREIAQWTRGTWASNPGAVYPLLRLLERQGLVSAEWEDSTRRTRRTYYLTDAGRQEYLALKELMRPALREAVLVMQGLFEELYAEEPGANRPGESQMA